MARTRGWWVIGAVTALTVAACAAPSVGSLGATDGRATLAGSAAEDPTQVLIADALRLADSYDYDAALALLRGRTGAAIERTVRQINARKASASAYPMDRAISHLFWHSLVVDPQRAFRGPIAAGFEQYMVTVTEFRRQLQDLYERGYVLVHPQRIAAPGADGTMTRQPIVLPPGKKPLVLSVDDVSYYTYMDGKGFASRLKVGANGRIVNDYTDATGRTTSGSYDVLPIVDDFVRAHPDFSYRGDKGTLALTGYNGVLGYRTSIREYGDNPTTRAQIAEATTVARAITADGWQFASHTWGHRNVGRDSLAMLTADAQRWTREVQPIVGPTRSFVFPFGADISGIRPYGPDNAKYELLHKTLGFDYLFPIDASTPAWMQVAGGSLRQARVNVDGLSMQRALGNSNDVLWTFFDVAASVDPDRPMPVPGDTSNAGR
ncbi:polysaccharide deacetylase family protein [Calidifontibacter sp. DB0510]|uniref:Polysaccharide deacetylase family protein n=1 Tax=Metallococcus carri TaxID=1656884 RepID=A0A967EHG7_9MICO|nr:polysaccharide deacetylase family protein [Metallococcus carri]NHN56328.1 polysaccharide deacetylase family protein [Metallococcus carri]NOP35952.1 polysaccharide deacetylase family protein [Calidifontibacter sp. DB2511S]